MEWGRKISPVVPSSSTINASTGTKYANPDFKSCGYDVLVQYVGQATPTYTVLLGGYNQIYRTFLMIEHKKFLESSRFFVFVLHVPRRPTARNEK
jgi:hypothetical protein